MAKMLFTAVVADMRNKLAGTVFSKNKYGAYTRTKVTPANPRTGFQSDARSLLASLSSAWRGLTQAQRDTWLAGASAFPQTDVFGNTQILSGQVLFIRFNTNLVNIGEAIITSCPTPQSLGYITNLTISADASPAALQIDWIRNEGTGSEIVQIWATPPYSAGKTNVENQYRLIATAAIADETFVLLSAYTARFGSLTAGQKVSIKLVVVSPVSGEQSTPVSAYQVISA